MVVSYASILPITLATFNQPLYVAETEREAQNFNPGRKPTVTVLSVTPLARRRRLTTAGASGIIVATRVEFAAADAPPAQEFYESLTRNGTNFLQPIYGSGSSINDPVILLPPPPPPPSPSPPPPSPSPPPPR